MEYSEREEEKDEGRKIYHNEDSSIYMKARALLLRIIPAYYWRAREHIEARKDTKKCLRLIRGKKYYPGYTLDIDHYTRHYIYSMGHMWDKDVLDIIEKQFHYPPEKTIYIPKGYTTYIFKGDKI